MLSQSFFFQMVGGGSSYQCGVVGTGTAAVFNGPGQRSITTVDINTSDAHFLQFHYLAGTISDVSAHAFVLSIEMLI